MKVLDTAKGYASEYVMAGVGYVDDASKTARGFLAEYVMAGEGYVDDAKGGLHKVVEAAGSVADKVRNRAPKIEVVIASSEDEADEAAA